MNERDMGLSKVDEEQQRLIDKHGYVNDRQDFVIKWLILGTFFIYVLQFFNFLILSKLFNAVCTK